MNEVHYDFLITHYSCLQESIDSINMCQDKIIAVTQRGDSYTIFYERCGNRER